MEEFYSHIRAIHIGAAIVSGLLLLVRGLARNALGAVWVTAWPVRILSYTIDTASLAGAAIVYGFIVSVARAHHSLGFFA